MNITKNKASTKKGFTIIELIVVMGVVAILLFLGIMGFKGYTKQAKFTRLMVDAKVLTDACERYFVDTGDYPRLVDTPYTSDDVKSFASTIYDHKGTVVTLDSSGKYFDIDYSKLKKYAVVKEDYKNFILQNPIGEVYILDPGSNTRTNLELVVTPGTPTVTVDTTNNPPVYNISYPNGITPQVTEYQLDGGAVVTVAPVDLLSSGSHNIKIRYKYTNVYSDWASADFVVANGVVKISGGNNFTVALMQDGSVKAWGLNTYGELGTTVNNGTMKPNPTPTAIPGLTGVKDIAAANNFTVALMQDGSVKAWGTNSYGQLGITANTTANPIPTTIPGLTGVAQIAAGAYYSIAVMQDGTAKSWGRNDYGQLGILTNSGTANPNPTPTVIPGITGVKQISAGANHAMALLQDGTIKAWGFNEYGELGTTVNNGTMKPNPTPTTIPGLTGVTQISVGAYHSIALMQDATVKAWGYNVNGELGILTNSGTVNPTPTPTMIPGVTGVKQISAGTFHTVALMQDGTVKAWGRNLYGELGNTINNGTSNANPTPTAIAGLTGVMQISAGGYHAMALMQGGTAKAWGYNYYGQLGTSDNIGTGNPNPTPITISGF